MATNVVNEPIQEFHGESLTVPGSSAARGIFLLRKPFGEFLFEPQAAMRLVLSPRIELGYFYDASAAVGSRWKDLASRITNRHVAGDTSTILDAMQTGDFIYLGCKVPFLGFWVDMDASAINGNTATLAMAYSKSDSTFASGTISSDGTVTSSATLAKDGLVVITVPTDWMQFKLSAILSDLSAPSRELYWLRFSVSAALSADIEMEGIAALQSPVSVGAYLKANVEYTMGLGDEVGSLEVLAQADAATSAKCSWIRRR